MKFFQLFKSVSISLSPNTEKDDVLLALKLLFQPWRWKKESAENSSPRLEEEFKKYLSVGHAIAFNSGRSALMAILNSLELSKNVRSSPPFAAALVGEEDKSSSSPLATARVNKDDEILLQAFTCNAAVNPIIWSGLKPVYVDCDENTFNIDIGNLKRKITSNSKAVIVQHTFGLPSDMNEIVKICQENNLILIEDCAHSLGAEIKVGLAADFVGRRPFGRPKAEARRAKVGTFGKAAFFSFSRDKVISSVYGGMVVTNDEELAKKIREYQERAGYPSYFWIKQQLLHPILINWLILPTYSILGKYFLILFQWLQILSKAVHWKEKRGLKPGYFPKRLPNALAVLALNQFKKLDKFNTHRKEIAQIYRKELKDTLFELPQGEESKFSSSPFAVAREEKEQIYLRFTVKHPKAHEIIKKAWQKNLLIGDWYTNPVAPDDTKLDRVQYVLGSCPKAEKLSQKTFNLPTQINISEKETKRIINFLRPWR